MVGGPYAGKYQWNRWPFGLTQAPAYFQQVVHEVIEGLTFAYGYLDDILVFSKSIEEHFQHCEIIFQRLRKYKLKLSYEKCAFLKSQVQYLGHLLSVQGLSIPFACIGSGDPVRVLHLYTMNTLDIL